MHFAIVYMNAETINAGIDLAIIEEKNSAQQKCSNYTWLSR